MKKRIKQAIFVVFMAVLILPAIQFKLNLVKVRPLGGTYQYAERPAFSKKAFLKGEYQENYSKYISDHFGFREICLRTHNQLWYSLFRIPNAQQVIIGKRNVLFEKNYIRDYTGTDFVGKNVIDTQIEKIKFLQDTLNKQGKKLILYFAPGKASFFPEDIPQVYLDSAQELTNYKYYTWQCKEHSLCYFDMNAWFMSRKHNSTYPLYQRGGIHWSSYGWALALDTLCRFMSDLQGAPLPKMQFERVELSDTARDTDNDIEKALNLLYDLPHDQYAYPVFNFQSDENTRKPKVLMVADSYWWNVFGSGNTSHVFGGSTFWYYNAEVYYEDGRPTVTVDQLNLMKEVSETEFIIILSTEANLYNYGWGFIDRLYDLYTKGWSQYSEEEISGQINQIRSDPEWLKLIEEKALNNHIPVDSQLREDAIYMLTIR